MIIYASRTGNVRYIVSKLHGTSEEIKEDLRLSQPFLLITYTDHLGEIPVKVQRFLEGNHTMCKGVVVSGNRNFGTQYFGGAGDKISIQYKIPLVRKLDLRGFQADYEAIQMFYETRILHENLLKVK